MMTHGMKIRRHLRSVRTSTLTEEQRRQELREAEERAAHGHRDEPPESKVSPRAFGD